MTNRYASLQEKWQQKVGPADAGDCWPWTGTVNTNGYGRLRHQNKQVQAHRVAYELFIGPIPDGAVIDHLCRKRSCVNPAHLEAVSNRENVVRGESPSVRSMRADTCRHGHEKAKFGYIDKRNQWACRECSRISSANGHLRRKALRAAHSE